MHVDCERVLGSLNKVYLSEQGGCKWWVEQLALDITGLIVRHTSRHSVELCGRDTKLNSTFREH